MIDEKDIDVEQRKLDQNTMDPKVYMEKYGPDEFATEHVRRMSGEGIEWCDLDHSQRAARTGLLGKATRDRAEELITEAESIVSTFMAGKHFGAPDVELANKGRLVAVEAMRLSELSDRIIEHALLLLEKKTSDEFKEE